jgi:DNA-binding MarR family transcriptional regulator
MTQQFYQLTLSEAISLHKCGLIQAPALLYFFLRTRLAPGWKMTLHQQEISQHLGISRTAFYKAIQKLKDKGLIDWEAPNGLVVTVAESATQSQKVLLSSRKCDSVIESATTVAESATATPSKPSEVGEADWENHPKRDEWIAQIRQGRGRFVALGGPREEWEKRQAFADWAIANHLVWGNKL